MVVKHTNPCGAAVGPDVATAFERARASDPVSIYGGIVGVNRPVDRRLVEALAGILLEILFAPAFEPDALDELRRTKKKLRRARGARRAAARRRGAARGCAASRAGSWSRRRTWPASTRSPSAW